MIIASEMCLQAEECAMQVLAGFARPNLLSKLRRLSNVSHWWIGRLAAAIGVAEVFYGLWLSQPATGYFVTALVTLLGVGSIAVCVNLTMPKPVNLSILVICSYFCWQSMHLS